MSKPTVLVTRPDPAGSELCRELDALGYDALHLPTLAFTAPPDLDGMHAAIAAMGEQDWLIFVSPQAVLATIPELRRKWPIMPPSVNFAAVGSGTANALRDAGYNAMYPVNEWSSEGLLAMPEFNEVKGKRIAIVRGVGGRELLEPVLAARGAKVMPVISYQRVLPGKTITDQYKKVFLDKTITVMICASASSVVNMKELIDERQWDDIRVIPLIVISERIKKIAYETGFVNIWVAENASQSAIVDTIKEIRYVR